MPKATAVFDADDSRLSGALARINGRMRMRRLQCHRLQSKRGRGGGHVAVAGVDGGASFLRRAGEMERVGRAEEDWDGSWLIFRRATPCHTQPRNGILAAWRMWPMRTAFSWMRKKTR